ncbi:MAG TPA: hypothetical protein VNN09_04465 [Candidatus Competibacteraceae bacterium]|nr:hypothetical protein [Candidatus Competibacteraceae bacterium]
MIEIDNVVIADHIQIMDALQWYRLGADFADALHLAVCGDALMRTFDRGFCKGAQEAGLPPHVTGPDGTAGSSLLLMARSRLTAGGQAVSAFGCPHFTSYLSLTYPTQRGATREHIS